ncbi:hypothetical protein J4050_14420 [Winogradskyella sp. DF17]|uniref:Uncharacterized protein n=1 Tax=Winogradskyella pelagia TaxID=2819984 RepID=A0ABS3T5B6_9FLAO|nr:hypothetical protein [Winogradskyella sp. DF17]MBO3117948.1 hypothetical protein [Winogradskyella sp. DF17]
MNSNNKFTELAIDHHLTLSQLAQDLLEIDKKLEKVNSNRDPDSKYVSAKILNLFIKLLV